MTHPLARRRPLYLGLAVLVSLALVGSACGDSDVADTSNDTAALLTGSGSATRAATPFTFVQTLRTEVAGGTFLEQRTEGVFDRAKSQASLVISSTGDARGVFTAETTVDLSSILSIVVDVDVVYLRVDFRDVDDSSLWTRTAPSDAIPDADGTVAMLGAALVARVTEAEFLGSETVGGVDTGHYRVGAAAADLAIYLPTGTLNLLVEQGFRRANVADRTTVEFWLDDAGRIRRMVIDHFPLVRALSAQQLNPGGPITALTQTFEVVGFGEGEVVVPDESEVSSPGG